LGSDESSKNEEFGKEKRMKRGIQGMPGHMIRRSALLFIAVVWDRTINPCFFEHTHVRLLQSRNSGVFFPSAVKGTLETLFQTSKWEHPVGAL